MITNLSLQMSGHCDLSLRKTLPLHISPVVELKFTSTFFNLRNSTYVWLPDKRKQTICVKRHNLKMCLCVCLCVYICGVSVCVCTCECMSLSAPGHTLSCYLNSHISLRLKLPNALLRQIPAQQTHAVGSR